LQRLEHLKELEQSRKLHFSSLSYEKVSIKPGSIIYCDPPYKGTVGYPTEFNTENFLNWADAQSNPVFISEYEISDKRFRCIKKIRKAALLPHSKLKRTIKEEKLYVNQAGWKALLSKKPSNSDF
jgi:DNA adenine methylase